MKHFTLLLISLIISSCSSSLPKETPKDDYSSFLSYHLKIETIFDLGLENYNIYFYSKECGYCNELKNDVLAYARVYKDLYFVDTTSLIIPIKEREISLIGATSLNDFFLYGIPSLLTFNDEKIIKVYTGIYEISMFLER